ncbi:hypothetical protein AB0E08_07430 [Streptomyces sp. NPDC048281]|uniref:hypothetical protein n=1 Tax=Streptomyces sp. NPDC048281 TaxID=3154715 RepID=UPI0034383C22
MTKSNAAIVEEFGDKARAAIANAEEAREKAQGTRGHDGRTDAHTDANRMFAEGILFHYTNLGIKWDGTLMRQEGETDEDMVKHLRRGRRNLIEKMLFTPEQLREGIAGLQQYYGREGAKRFLADTTFVRAEGEL